MRSLENISLREALYDLVVRMNAEITCDSTMRYGTRIVNADTQVSAILALIRDRLLSEEAVMAGARKVAGLGPYGTPLIREKDEFRIALLAAMDRIESHDR